ALALHWDGTAWMPVALPVPAHSGSGRLEAVAVLALNDAWAVGHYEGWAEDQESLTFTLHWDGTAWRLVYSPNSRLGKWNRLTGVAAVSANDVWAVGSATNGDHRFSTLALHWDG